MKKTLIIGATTNPARYAYTAANRLVQTGNELVQIGLKEGKVAGVSIDTEKKDYPDIDTVTLYIGPRHQPAYYDYVVSLHPKRVIFNPGTENPEFSRILIENNIEPVGACTLVMLAIGQY